MRLGSIRALTSSPTHLGLRQADVAFGLDPHHFPGQGAKWTQVRQIVGNQNIDALVCLAGAWWILQQCAILRRCCQDSCSNRTATDSCSNPCGGSRDVGQNPLRLPFVLKQ